MSNSNKVRNAVYSTSRKITAEVAANLEDVVFEPNAQDLIAELTLKKLFLFASDLEHFERHAKRSTVTADDVKLLVRRNPSLKNWLEAKEKVIQLSKGSDGGNGKRKRKLTSDS